MIKNIMLLIRRFIGEGIDTTASIVKIQTTIQYIKFIRGTRQAAILFMLLVLSTVLMAFGLIIIPIALCIFMPWDAFTKIIVLSSFAALYFFVSLFLLLRIFSERTWMRAFKADILVHDALQ